MYRTQSTQSYQGNVRVSVHFFPHALFLIPVLQSPKRSSSPASLRESGMLSTLHTGTTKKGTRMLNGRVYGARRGSASGKFLILLFIRPQMVLPLYRHRINYVRVDG
ncbi:hypothetical protein GYMLUDRAFT_48680 [Collybiopsis luxurians FD-317 M1]|uniref:Uncharacterized protein n=1 Tax=Collybiopsis luxurians FD-317 M1 TaxID=944289 RepID=A0A0D0CI04_9AGAR|nr:hypothetical protein GYMLUDRAFT_48680 [Collybiopsis luxurians FD-317 M1]